MRKFWSTGLALAAALAATFGAVPASAATNSVLTIGSLGGPPALVGDVLIASGTANFLINSTSTAGIHCQLSARATVQTNPPAPGTAVTSLTTLPFSSCSSNLSNFTVSSVTADHLPYQATFASSLAVAVSAGPSSVGPVQVTIIGSSGPVSIICVYQPQNGQIPGTYANSNNSVTLGSVVFKKTTGSSLCPNPLLFSAQLRPLVDASRGGLLVYVN
jgi:hypothetical protein